jgi:hypothetical protein
MKKLTGFLVGAMAVVGPVAANADTLTLTVTADNAYALYLSTSDLTLGTAIPGANNYGGPAGQWSTSTTYTVNLTAPAYYLHVVGSNYTPQNGLWSDPGTPNGGGGNPDGFIGSFSISGSSNYTFGNGTAALDTNTANWTGIAASDNTSWTTPVSAVQSYGTNGVAPWGTVSGISSTAEWIWSNPDNTQYADLSTLITSTTSRSGQTPLPGALPLLASGLGAFGLLRWRKKRAKA